MQTYDTNKKTDQTRIAHAFIGIETVLLMFFLIADLLGKTGLSCGLKYASILLCALFAWMRALKSRDYLISLGLSFTCGADLFLLVLLDHYVVGLLLFSGAQFSYALEIRRLGARGPVGLAVAPIAFCLLLAACSFVGVFSALADAGALYISLFLGNIVNLVCLSAGDPSPKRQRCRVFLLGMILYLICDILVGVFNLGPAVPYDLRELARILIWLFYLPGKVLIVLSSYMEASL